MTNHYPFELPSLPYSYDALEPYIDTETMFLHHNKHLATYVDNLNKTLAPYPQLHTWSLQQLIMDLDRIPDTIKTAVKNNAGGVYNHIFYFYEMAPQKLNSPRKKAIQDYYGSISNWEQEFKKFALSVFGSGYAWFLADENGNFSFITTPNQDTPLDDTHFLIFNIDVWEHAYYLKNQNRRADYIDNWFSIIKNQHQLFD